MAPLALQPSYGIRPVGAGPEVILQRRRCKLCSAATLEWAKAAGGRVASVTSALRVGQCLCKTVGQTDRLCILKYRDMCL